VTKKPAALLRTLLRYCRGCGLSANALAKAAGVPQATLSRFLAGQRSVALATAERLATYFELELQPRQRDAG
jgi:plasmid maintenance system antidote protein VapI